MLTSVHGVYQGGRILLKEDPATIQDGTEVIVTFLEKDAAESSQQILDPEIMAELRWAFAPFAEEWNSPEMDIYDDYDASRKRLATG